ncbi:hypothetical protein JCM10207_004162 [Rhodosporidiobolus poonsookiae]
MTEQELDDKMRVFEAIAEDYHDIVTELPLEYHRTFALMRELEDAQQSHTSSLRSSLTAYLSTLGTSPSSAASPAPSTPTSEAPPTLPRFTAANRASLGQLNKLATDAIRAGEDKVGLAISLYESVDRHIRRLDADLAKWEDSLVIGLREGTMPSHDAPAAARKDPPGATTSRGAIALGEKEAWGSDGAGEGAEEAEEGQEGSSPRGAGAGGGRKGRRKSEKSPAEAEKEREWKRRREVQKLERHAQKKEDRAALKKDQQAQQQEQILMPIDPNEPTYCYCDRVAFGEMIACENEDCKREWFHLECVELDAAPEGTWYCTECIKALGIDPRTMKPR